MSNYKDFPKIFIGSSDYSTLVLAMPGRDSLITELNFGEDGAYYAYLTPTMAEIGGHYNLVAKGAGWLKIYDDEGLVFYARAKTIDIYRAGEYGCIISLGENAEVLRTFNGTTDNAFYNRKLTERESVTIKELVEKSGRSKSVIYKLAKELGRTPTLAEIENRPTGRPKKY